MRRALVLGLAALALAGAASSPEPPDGFVDAATLVPGLVIEMRYAGSHNFVGRPIDGYEASRCLLTRAAATALARVQAELARFGLGLRVYDCYRPTRAVADFARWARDLADTRTKAEFYPDVAKSELFAKGYIAEHSSHSRGSTVDLTLVALPGLEPLDMGTPFDLFSTHSWPTDPEQPAPVRAHRLLLASVMGAHGFEPYPLEWWHFTLAGEPYPETAFDFPVR